MIRHLLTLLALCAGFAAIGTPAHAVQAVEATDQVASAAVASAPIAVVRLIGAAPAARWVQERSRPAPRRPQVGHVPAVHVAIDRARR